MSLVIGILTVSDSRTPETDVSGPAIQETLFKLGYDHFEARLVADQRDLIAAAIRDLAEECAAVFTTGGTGFGPRDVTPEATLEVIDRRADNLAELLRLKGLEHTAMSYLSRGVAGIVGSTLVVNLPGSPKGAKQGIEALAPLLRAILSNLGGEGCPAH